MGDYFKDIKKEEPEEEKAKPITEPQVLFATYDGLVNKIQLVTDEGYNAILPIRQELIGNDSPDDLGQIGEIRRKIRETKFMQMSIGILTWQSLENIESLTRWSDRYIDYMETFIKDLRFVSRSAFIIIKQQEKMMREMRREVEMYKDKLLMQTDPYSAPPNQEAPRPAPKPAPAAAPPTPTVPKKGQFDDVSDEVFEKRLAERTAKYKTAFEQNLKGKGLAKGQLSLLRGAIPERIKKVNAAIQEIEGNAL